MLYVECTYYMDANHVQWEGWEGEIETGLMLLKGMEKNIENKMN